MVQWILAYIRHSLRIIYIICVVHAECYKWVQKICYLYTRRDRSRWAVGGVSGTGGSYGVEAKITNSGLMKPEVVFCGRIWLRAPIARRRGSNICHFLAVCHCFRFSKLLPVWNTSHQIDHKCCIGSRFKLIMQEIRTRLWKNATSGLTEPELVFCVRPWPLGPIALPPRAIR